MILPAPEHVTTVAANYNGDMISQSFPPPYCNEPVKETLGLGGKGLKRILQNALHVLLTEISTHLWIALVTIMNALV